MINGYIKKIFQPKNDEKIIPINWAVKRIFHFYFTGWNLSNFNTESSEFLNSLRIASASIHTFYSIYSDKFAFTEPMFSVYNDETVSIKVGIIELEIYEEICNRDLEQNKNELRKQNNGRR
jgi:hypothetical protein